MAVEQRVLRTNMIDASSFTAVRLVEGALGLYELTI